MQIRLVRNIIRTMKKSVSKKSSSTINITHTAKLANLPLSEEEKKKFEQQLSETLTYVESLNDIDTKNVNATSQVTGLENVLRDDVAGPSLSQKDALKNSKSTDNGFFKVPAILEE